MDWYDKLFHDQMILDALCTTLAVSSAGGSHRHRCGHLCRHRLLQYETRWRTPLVTTINNIPMVNAEIVTGVSMLPVLRGLCQRLWGILPTGSTEPSGSSCPSSCTWASAPCSSPTSPSTSPM
ncbi:MAG: hypothetical protein ACLRWQ_21300 [Flavonifractor plautii]